MSDELFLSQTDNRPMYLQVMEQIKLKIMAGDWPHGYALPSIRELAAATKVSVITIKRAYSELEQAGLIVTRPGRGSLVAEGIGQSALRQQELSQHIARLLEAADKLGIDNHTLQQQLAEALKQRQTPPASE